MAAADAAWLDRYRAYMVDPDSMQPSRPVFCAVALIGRTGERRASEAAALSTFYLHSCAQMVPNEATQSRLTLRILC